VLFPRGRGGRGSPLGRLSSKATPGVAFDDMARGPRKLGIVGRPDTLTRFGGVYLLHRFVSAIGLKRAPGCARIYW